MDLSPNHRERDREDVQDRALLRVEHASHHVHESGRARGAEALREQQLLEVSVRL